MEPSVPTHLVTVTKDDFCGSFVVVLHLIGYTYSVDALSPPKPAWLRLRLPPGDEAGRRTALILERQGLRTVCDEARCPNKGECWNAGTAAFMLMGDLCTRNCRFCAVASSRQGRELRPDEGAAITRAVRELGLSYVVLTSVDRDDLDDRGAGHFASCVTALKAGIPGIKIELLTPDYTQAELAGIAGAAPHVFAHNVETVRAFQWVRASRASFDASLATLRAAKALGIKVTKSSLLLGLGETGNAVLSAMDELREAGVDILVMGQYLRPSKKQIPVAEYISPAQFDAYAEEGRNRGFASVVASPFARTSYHAAAAAREILGEEAAGGRHAD